MGAGLGDWMGGTGRAGLGVLVLWVLNWGAGVGELGGLGVWGLNWGTGWGEVGGLDWTYWEYWECGC